MTIYIGSDHGGFKTKQALIEYLKELGREVEDMGPESYEPADDYPDFSFRVADAVAQEPDSLGILLCRSGQGVCIVANKVKGVRAAVAWDQDLARASRRDDHVNVLCLPSDYISLDLAKAIVSAWLSQAPGQDDRFKRRLQKIKAIEEHK